MGQLEGVVSLYDLCRSFGLVAGVEGDTLFSSSNLDGERGQIGEGDGFCPVDSFHSARHE